jgi:hypothetical protein
VHQQEAGDRQGLGHAAGRERLHHQADRRGGPTRQDRRAGLNRDRSGEQHRRERVFLLAARVMEPAPRC